MFYKYNPKCQWSKFLIFCVSDIIAFVKALQEAEKPADSQKAPVEDEDMALD